MLRENEVREGLHFYRPLSCSIDVLLEQKQQILCSHLGRMGMIARLTGS